MFKGELKFKKALGNNKNQISFLPIKLGYDDDPSYPKCIGHFIDGMGSLPYRPDYMFDACFRVIDELGKGLFPGKGLAGISQGLGDKLLTHSRVEWGDIINSLGRYIPLMTCEFLVKRIVEANTILVNKDK